MDDAELGSLTRQGDRWMLTFTRRLAHPREKVWRAVTEPEHLAAWYPQEIVGERRAGAPLRLVRTAGGRRGHPAHPHRHLRRARQGRTRRRWLARMPGSPGQRARRDAATAHG